VLDDELAQTDTSVGPRMDGAIPTGAAHAGALPVC
jgi:hypothetical protein